MRCNGFGGNSRKGAKAQRQANRDHLRPVPGPQSTAYSSVNPVDLWLKLLIRATTYPSSGDFALALDFKLSFFRVFVILW
jgi:hypothetical protein